MNDSSNVPSAVEYPDGYRLDTIKGATVPADKGMLSSDSGDKYLDYHDFIISPLDFQGVSEDASERWDVGIGYLKDGGKVDVTLNLSGTLMLTYDCVKKLYARISWSDGTYNDIEIPLVRNPETFLYDLSRVGKVSFENVPTGYFSVSVILDVKLDPDLVVEGVETITYRLTTEEGKAVVSVSPYVSDYFTIRIPQIGFDISTRASLASGGIATIAMKDGMCAGRSFDVDTCTYDPEDDSWVLQMYRGLDESLNMYFPNSNYPIAEGDHYVLTDIVMPDLYVGLAAERLKDYAYQLLADLSRVMPFYEPEIDAKVMAEQQRYLLEGRYMMLTDEDIVEDSDNADGVDFTDYVLIDTLTINESEYNIPTYRATLRERKKITFRQATNNAITNVLTSLAGGSGTSTGGGGASVYERLKGLPSIDGVALKGEMRSYEDLGLISTDFFELDTTSVPGKKFIRAKFDGLYTLGSLAAGGVGSASSGGNGGGPVKWNQLFTDADNGTQIANITLGTGETIPVYVPNTLQGGLSGLLTLDGSLNEGDIPYWDGHKWTNRQIGSVGGGTGSVGNPYYDDAIIATMSDGSVVRTELTNGKVPAWWTYNVLGLKTTTQQQKLVKVEIGKNCTSVGDHAFYNCTNLKTIYSYASVQCAIDSQGGSAFTQLNSYNGVLHYPSGSDYSWWTEAYGQTNFETLGDWNWTSRADAVTPTTTPEGGSGSGSGGGESVTVINSLTSSSTTAALSAKQGRVLNEKIDALKLADLVGVSISSPSNGQVLTFKNGGWTNADLPTASGGGATKLSGLSDVALSSLTAGDLLFYNGQSWVNFPSSNLRSEGGITELSGLSDVTLSKPSNGDVLYFNGEKWVNYPSTNFGTTSPNQPSTIPLAANGTRGGVQLGFETDGLNVAVEIANEKIYVPVPKMYIGTTQVQLSSLAQSLEGITNLTASGTLRAGTASITGSLTAKELKANDTLRIGDAQLTYANGIITLQLANGGDCSFFATGNLTAGR